MTRTAQRPGALYDQFGSTCPVCGLALGSPVRWDSRTRRFEVPPCFRLEIGPPDRSGSYSWRVTAIGAPGASFPPAVSQMPVFVESEIEYVYLLCSDGHIFPQAEPVNHRGADDRQRVDRWNMVAAVGAPASGKTYLLVRMMSQNLTNAQNIFPTNDRGRIQRHQLNPLEQVPMDERSDEYTKTVTDRKAINPTQGEDTRPALILERLLEDALDAIRAIIRRTVVDGDRRAERWGMGFRQPLVVRTSSNAMLTWTGIADLPGELFSSSQRDVRERNKLRAYDALIWVIDPAVAEAAIDPLTKESLSEADDYDSVLDGSLRPGTTVVEGPASIRAKRERTQRDIGASLTLIGNNYTADQGRALELLIAVSKCDLIHAALRRKKKLVELGRRDSVRQGVAAYLASVCRRMSERELAADEQTRKLLDYLHGARSAQRSVHEQRIFQVADGLLEHYSDEQAFWRLVHEGTKDFVDIPGNGGMVVSARRIEVASIGEHLDQSTAPGSAEILLIRDLVMSALGCGIAFGLGQENTVATVLRNDWQRIRLFLCSPLTTVPIGRTATSGQSGQAQIHRLEPMDPAGRFPQMEDESAALIQLLLAALRKARA